MNLSDILAGSGGGDIRDLWDSTEAAGEMGPLPPGEYIAHIIAGELETSRTNSTPGYKLTFSVIEGDYIGRRFWLDCWLTPAALPQTKRDVAKLGVKSLEQLERPLPRGIRCKCKLALRKDDNGDERNRVKSFDVVGIDPPEVDPFAPATPSDDQTATSEAMQSDLL
ncbi:hypothetical protein EC9_02610 [Rosistilla ulvae]|uniref:DUF669 domain-containing protein n=1 Tax=Rosistilla ulvae TaxID=1930277 RepID=A0A517LTZ6_9BACT|nr:DUF669 domain-containing protein [Rosistilla ulvae]QDS86103.1 hypothetical protein EC9_02610 [Rosistilla ulvae]